MSVARITTINLNTKEDADEMVKSYTENVPGEFPEAKQLFKLELMTK